jgi:hypothetical protein
LNQSARTLLEHEAPVKSPIDSNTPEIQQTREEIKTVKLVLDLLAEGQAAKREISKDWDTRWDFYHDQQWENLRPANRSTPVLNVIKITIQSLLPILTDAKPGFNALPQDPSDYKFAEIVGKLTESWWERRGLDQILVEVLYDCMIYDAGILKVTWDQEEDHGIGDIKVDTIDPRDIYVPSDAKDFDRNCPWVIHLMDKNVGEIRRKFPDMAEYITADSGRDKHEKTQNYDKVHLVSPVDQEPKVKNSIIIDGNVDIRDKCTIAEAWLDDNAIVEYEEVNKETGETEKKARRKYPHGKVVTVLVNKRLLLSERPNPYRHMQKPFVRFVDNIKPRKFWGEGEVSPLMSIQKVLNKTLANIIDYMNFTSNPVWFVEAGSGVNVEKITNSYGLIVRTNNGGLNKVKRDIPPPLPAYIMNFYNILREAAQLISGASDITQGRRPVGVTAAAAIETVQEAAHTRVRLKERNMQVSLSKLGRQIIALMMQFYTLPRVIRIAGEKSEWPQFFEFFVDQLPDDKVQFNKRDFKFNRETGEYVPNDTFVQGPPSKGTFDIRVLSGTSLPFAKAQRSNLALRLFENQSIDQEELLESLEWPNKEQVLERMRGKIEAAKTGGQIG